MGACVHLLFVSLFEDSSLPPAQEACPEAALCQSSNSLAEVGLQQLLVLCVLLPGLKGQPHALVLELASRPGQLVPVLMRLLYILLESCKALQAPPKYENLCRCSIPLVLTTMLCSLRSRLFLADLQMFALETSQDPLLSTACCLLWIVAGRTACRHVTKKC